jgi:chemotaxis protein methyltransferase WspC
LKRFLGVSRLRRGGLIRLLSVGCSTGEEVYSLAIALREAGLEPARFFILGTDVSRRSLDSARRGTFSSRSFREPEGTIDPERGRWFERQGESWRVRHELRESVEFQWGNLAQGEFLCGETPFQVVFCRNVLIYFHADARRAAVGHFRRLLGPDGFLCTAPAEAHVFADAGFSSRGSDCPFAFRSPHRATQPPQATVPVRQPPVAPPSVPEPVGRIHNPSYKPSDEGALVHLILKAAQQAADDGRLEAADALCGRLLAQDGANAEAHYLQGVVRQAHLLGPRCQVKKTTPRSIKAGF